MGNGVSRLTEHDLMLVPQSPIVTAIDPRFCVATSITLELKAGAISSMNGGDFRVRNAVTNDVVFEVRGKELTARRKRTMLDKYGVAIVNTKDAFFTEKCKRHVYAGSERGQTSYELFTIVAERHSGSGVELKFEFLDRLSGQPCRMGVEGDWDQKRAILWVDVGKSGNRATVGRVSLPYTESVDSGRYRYHVEIAAGMDLAVMVLLCMALDDAVKDHKERNSDLDWL